MCFENYKMVKNAVQEVLQEHRNELEKMHEAMQDQFHRALQEQQNVIMGALWKLRENQQQLLELLKEDKPPLENSKDQEDLQQPPQEPQSQQQFQEQYQIQQEFRQQQMGLVDELQPKRKRGGARKRRSAPSVYGVPPNRMWMNQFNSKQYLSDQQQQIAINEQQQFYQQEQQVSQEDDDVQLI